VAAFGELLKGRRGVAGLSLRELGSRSGLHWSYLDRLERGERAAPSVEAVESVARALAADEAMTDELLRAAGHPPHRFARLGWDDPELAGVARVLTAAPLADQQRFRGVLRLLLEQWAQPG
jgi:transcriptional regulator with XRE-family HTH domain